MLNYICGRGYTLVGDKFSVCVDGRWSHPTPKCAGMGTRHMGGYCYNYCNIVWYSIITVVIHIPTLR